MCAHLCVLREKSQRGAGGGSSSSSISSSDFKNVFAPSGAYQSSADPFLGIIGQGAGRRQQQEFVVDYSDTASIRSQDDASSIR